jgi:hypothetical protein
MSTTPRLTDQPLPALYPPHDPDAHDGSLSELARALASINARLLAEAQQAEHPTQHAA